MAGRLAAGLAKSRSRTRQDPWPESAESGELLITNPTELDAARERFRLIRRRITKVKYSAISNGRGMRIRYELGEPE